MLIKTMENFMQAPRNPSNLRAASLDFGPNFSATKLLESDRYNNPNFEDEQANAITEQAMHNPEFHDDSIEKFVQILKMTTQAVEINIFSKDMV